MQISPQGHTTQLIQEAEGLPDFLAQLQQQFTSFGSQHLVLVLLPNQEIVASALSLISNISAAHRDIGKSFVVVTDTLTYETAPEELAVVPSVQEALDVIEMEDIERDLGI